MVEFRDEEDGRVALIMDKEELPVAVEALMRVGYGLTPPSRDGAEEPEAEAFEPEEPEEPEEAEDEAPGELEDDAEEPDEETEEPERRGPVRRRGPRARRLRDDATTRSRTWRTSSAEGERGPTVELKVEEDGRIVLSMEKKSSGRGRGAYAGGVKG